MASKPLSSPAPQPGEEDRAPATCPSSRTATGARDNFWTAEEDRLLRDLWPTGLRIGLIAQEIGRSRDGVSNRAIKLGLPRRKPYVLAHSKVRPVKPSHVKSAQTKSANVRVMGVTLPTIRPDWAQIQATCERIGMPLTRIEVLLLGRAIGGRT